MQNGKIFLQLTTFMYFDFAVSLTRVVDFVCALLGLGFAF